MLRRPWIPHGCLLVGGRRVGGPSALDPCRNRQNRPVMDAWILDESPGTYRWGSIDEPTLGPDDVAVRPVASALNHMDLWLTRAKPRPHLPHVPGCDVAGTV